MPSNFSLIPVVQVDEKKCVNCHTCISACPVKYCNDGSGDVVQINHDMCIGCGKCIDACTHDARTYIDDFQNFTNAIIAGEDIVAISAPSVTASFPNAHLKMNSFLKELGVKAVFDVSFGAELTIKSYIEHIKTNDPRTVIAQPCPAIVSYVELYQPKLLKYLAPVDSPILHTIKMIQKYYPQYKNHKIVVLSPCISKKREYEATGKGDFNVTLKSIDKFLKDNNVDLDSYAETQFDNPSAERAVLFSSPGGLTKTLERWIPDIECDTKRIEGVHVIYDYLNNLHQMIKEDKSYKIIDCLSCENGCNQGPVTLLQDKSPDDSEYWIKNRSKKLKKEYLAKNNNNLEKTRQELEILVEKYWNTDLYDRTYTNRWENVNICYPTKEQIQAIYKKMHKETNEDVLNCSACGYNSCEGMAVAIYNNLNKPENCHHYLKRQTELNLVEAENSKEKVEAVLHTAQDGFIEIDKNEIIVSSNDSMRRILKKKDIVGRSINEFIDSKYLKLLEKETNQRQKGIHSTYEIEFIQSDGYRICCLISASPMYDFKTKKIIGSFAMVSDISKLKETEKKLRLANESLEEKVLQRTAKLNEALEELQQQKEEILSQKNALAESEEKIHHILDILPNPAFVIDEKNRVTFWNDAIVRLTGLKSDEIRGRGNYAYSVPFYGNPRPILIDLVRMDDETLLEKYSNVEKKGNFLRAESFVKDFKGKERYLLGTATAIYDKNKKYIGAIEVLSDITEIKKNEQKIETQTLKLIEQSEKMSEILEELQVRNDIIENINEELSLLSIVASETDNAITILDKNGQIDWINKAFTKIYGYNLEELFEKRGKTIFKISTFPEIESIFDKVVSTKKSETYTSLEVNKQGEEIHIQSTISPVLDEQGNIVNLVVVDSDITLLKETVNILRQQQKEIIEQKNEIEEYSEKINQIIESLPDPAFVINSNGEVEFWNRAMEKLTGIKSKDIIGKGDYEYSKPFYGEKKPILIDYITIEKADLEKKYKYISYKKGIIQAETYAPNLPEGAKHLIGTATAIYDKNGVFSGAIEIIHDITKMKQYLQKIETQRKDILASIRYSKSIQEAVFPPISLITDLMPQSFILFKPRDIISGDFYWTTLKDNKLILAIADCTGHGVPGALMSMLGISLLNEIVNGNNITQPNLILDLLRSQVIKALRQDENVDTRDGMDIALITYNIETKEIEFSGAHNPLIYIRNEELFNLKGDKMPISAQYSTEKPFTLQKITHQTDDVFYMFSDGYADQLSPDYKKFMRRNFYDLLMSIHHLDFEEQKQKLTDNLKNWQKNHPQTDDILIVGFSLDYYVDM